MIYAMLVVDILHRRKAKWLIPFFIIGIIQAIAFQSTWLSQYIVGGMEFLSLCIGSVFVIKIIWNACNIKKIVMLVMSIAFSDALKSEEAFCVLSEVITVSSC